MKLFRVEVTKVVYILAENEDEAESEGSYHACDESSEDILVDELTSFEQVESDWRDAIPYGGEEDLTVRQWFERPGEPKPYVDPPEQLRIDFDTPKP